MSKHTKAAIIERYGEEWYRIHILEPTKKRNKRVYDEDPEAARKAKNERRKKEYTKQYNEDHFTVYRINNRDRMRVRAMGLLKDGQVIHHNKYHADNADPTWIDDIELMTVEEHTKWHQGHPDFVAMENVV